MPAPVSSLDTQWTCTVRDPNGISVARRLGLLLASLVLHTLAMAPWSLGILAWIALVPLLLALDDLGPRAGALVGLAWGTAAIWGVGYWVPAALTYYYGQPAWFGYAFAFAASVVFAGSYFAGFGACTCWLVPRLGPLRRILLIPAVWVTWELARARLLTGEPWLLLGYALGPTPSAIQAADLGGVHLLSYAIVLVNAAIAEVVRAWPRRRPMIRYLAPALVTLLLAHGYGLWRLSTPLPDEPSLPLTVIQGNNDVGAQWREEYYGAGLAKYLQMSSDAGRRAKPELLVWPEAAVTFFLDRDAARLRSIAQMLAAADADLLVGGPYAEGSADTPRYHNSAFYITRDGKLAGRYDKMHLLPFAEYFPLRTIELLRRKFERVRFFTPGEDAAILDTNAGKIAVVICFEGIFPEFVRQQMARGAGLLVNLSNDAWLGRGAGPEQHLAMVRLRAVENRTWVVRATATGISAIIDPWGRIVARTGTLESVSLDGRVVPMHVTTIYQRAGDSFAWSCVLATVAAMCWTIAGGRGRSPSQQPAQGPSRADQAA